MAAPKYNIQLAINRGNLIFADLMEKTTVQARFGGCLQQCDESLETCLYFILDNLQIRLDNNILDDSTEALYNELVIMIGGVLPDLTGPEVTVDEEKTVSPGGSQLITANIIEGSSPILSILWVQKSGPTATLTNANTASVIITNYSLGDSIFEVTVTDQNGLTATAEIELHVVVGLVQIEFGYTETDPVGIVETIELESSFTINEYAAEYPVTFPELADLTYLVIKEPDTETSKNLWLNTDFNQGTLPDSKFRREVINGSRYYYSRTPYAFGSIGTERNYTIIIKN